MRTNKDGEVITNHSVLLSTKLDAQVETAIAFYKDMFPGPPILNMSMLIRILLELYASDPEILLETMKKYKEYKSHA